jgi:hypothetical protein
MQYCFICRPSDFTASHRMPGLNPGLTLGYAIRLSNRSATFYPVKNASVNILKIRTSTYCIFLTNCTFNSEASDRIVICSHWYSSDTNAEISTIAPTLHRTLILILFYTPCGWITNVNHAQTLKMYTAK